MTRDRLDTGRLGEEMAVREMRRLGYKKIVRNYRCPLGEMDLVARDGDTLVFVEIKTRRRGPVGYAKEAVDARKREQLSKVALCYMKENDCTGAKARFDVVAVSLAGETPDLEVVRNAFDLCYK